MNHEALIEQAKLAMNHAYVPYSNFRVGAALLTKSGRVFTGCNIENASYGATNCAERTAIFKAVSEGEREFVALAVVSHTESFTFPCGICRQVMSEFMPGAQFIFANKDEICVLSLEDLLPNRFNADLLES